MTSSSKHRLVFVLHHILHPFVLEWTAAQAGPTTAQQDTPSIGDVMGTPSGSPPHTILITIQGKGVTAGLGSIFGRLESVGMYCT